MVRSPERSVLGAQVIFAMFPVIQGLAAVGDVRKGTRLSEQRRIPVQRAFN
jgi:hypothetical protein